MASTITEYRVFIASPGGLEAERESFRNTLRAHNEADGTARGLIFSPVGWELTLGGIGRPQELINQDVKTSDYCVLVLWDRWGSPPAEGGPYTSGTEEEYSVAWQCYREAALPMREIVVFFKTVDHRRLSDPGPQLQKVLAFKKQLEEERKVLFNTFDDLASFTEQLHRYLAKWTRDHGAGTAKSQVPRPAPAAPSIEVLTEEARNADEEGDTFLSEAQDLLKQGKLTDAEAKLVQAVVREDNFGAFRAYGDFLLQSGRLTDAEAVYRRMHALALSAGNLSWAGTALAGLGGVYRQRPDFHNAHAALLEALQFKERSKDYRGTSQVLTWLGDTSAQFEKWPQARQYYARSLKLLASLGLDRAQNAVLFKYAKACARVGDDVEASRAGEEARMGFEAAGDKVSLKAVQSWRRAWERSRKK